MSSSNLIKQRSQLWRWRRLRPRPPKVPEHYPRFQASSHPPHSYRPPQRRTFFLLGLLSFFPPLPPLWSGRLRLDRGGPPRVLGCRPTSKNTRRTTPTPSAFGWHDLF